MTRKRTRRQWLCTLGAILVQAPTVAGLHRDGGTPVSPELVQEARALKARYHHLSLHQDTYRRIRREYRDHWHKQHKQRQDDQRDREQAQDQKQAYNTNRRHTQELKLEAQNFMEHLFRPPDPPKADTGEATNGDFTNDNKNSFVTLRQIGLEGSAEPLFFCSTCQPGDEEDEQDCARCKSHLIVQQQEIKTDVLKLYPDAKIVASTMKLVNVIFVEMAVTVDNDLAEMDAALENIPGVVKAIPQEDLILQDTDAALHIGAGTPLEERFCGVAGEGVRVAILDSGIDYTHARIGGPGTQAAWELAYGTNGPDSPENKQRNPKVFPTETVIDGFDFLGETFVHTAESVAEDAEPDNNPIDANRHGTMVADAVLSVAPKAKLIALKVCTADKGTCPGFAVISGLEWALDPNGDGNIDDRVDLVNLSLGGSYLTSYYDLRTKAMEKVFELGVLPVVAAGNEGNVPYIGGPGAKTPNALAVAATTDWRGLPEGSVGTVAPYSSRGPGENNALKPDISAPSGLSLAMYASGIDVYNNIQGTSFAAPIAAGAVALVKERCRDCSPFALKAILMNNAKRHVRYHSDDPTSNMTSLPLRKVDLGAKQVVEAEGSATREDDAPNSLVGAGELLVSKALDSDLWAYCIDDFQPSLSYGVINAYQHMTFNKTVKVINLSGEQQTVSIRNEFLRKVLPENEPQEIPFDFSFYPEEQVLEAGCNTHVLFDVTLTVDALKAPSNRMTSGGLASLDPAVNDWNEFGGHVVIESIESGKDISLPYHALIRQASHVKVTGTDTITDFIGGPTNVTVGLANMGAGVAQVDVFELLFTSEDDAEGAYGDEISPSDFRYIGYRVIEPEPVVENCDYLLEFAFTTWESVTRLNLEFFQVHVDIDFDGTVDYVLFNSGVFTPFTDTVGCVVRDKRTDEVKCTGMPPDHGTNTANTVLRVCTNDLGFEGKVIEQQQINVYILTATATHLGVTEVTDRASELFHTLEFPKTLISAPSYDIGPGGVLETMTIDGIGGTDVVKPLGLMLITNSYRESNSTGAATPESEVIILKNGELLLPTEVTENDFTFPLAADFEGPGCAEWKNIDSCATVSETVATDRSGESSLVAEGNPSLSDAMRGTHRAYRGQRSTGAILSDGVNSKDENDDVNAFMGISGAFDQTRFSSRQDGISGSCPEVEVPRAQVLTVPGVNLTVEDDAMLSQTVEPSFSDTPTMRPLTFTPSSEITDYPSEEGTPAPSRETLPSGTSQPTASLVIPVPSTESPTSSSMISLGGNSSTSQPVASLPLTPAPSPFRTLRPTGPVTAAVVVNDDPTFDAVTNQSDFMDQSAGRSWFCGSFAVRPLYLICLAISLLVVPVIWL